MRNFVLRHLSIIRKCLCLSIIFIIGSFSFLDAKPPKASLETSTIEKYNSSIQNMYKHENKKVKDKKLVFAIDLVRHGDSVSLKSQGKITNYWDDKKPGHLTDKGRRDAFVLGKKLRKYYMDKLHFLPKRFQNGILFVRTTHYFRTHETAQYVLKGLYPKDYNDIAVKEDETGLLMQPDPTREKEAYKKQYFFYRKDYDPNQTMKKKIERLSKVTGFPMTTDREIARVGDMINVNILNDVPMNINHDDQKEILKIYHTLVGNKFKINWLLCSWCENFITKILELIHNAAYKDNKLKYVLYAGHDNNILSTMSLFSRPLHTQVPYSADLRFELFKVNNEKVNNKFFVKVTYNNKPVKVCSSDYCELDEFNYVVRWLLKVKCDK